MPERRRGRPTRAAKTSGQTSLRDHFQKNVRPDAHEDSVTQTELLVQNSPEVVHISLDSSDDDSPELRADSKAQTSELRPKRILNMTTKQGHSTGKLFPIFTRPHREDAPPEIIDVDGDEAGTASEYGLSEAELPPLSSQTSPRSDFSHLTPSSHQASSPPPPSSLDAYPTIFGPDVACTDESTAFYVPKWKLASQTRTRWDSGNVPPFPDEESQHVRGLQHSYSASGPPLQTRSCSRSQARCDDCSLDFLRQNTHDDTDAFGTSQLWTPCDRLSSKPEGDHLQSSNTTPQPLSTSPKPNMSIEMWVHRFRPKRAEEVLGNEKHALYLRNWLRTLELQLQDKQTADPGSMNSQCTNNKQTGKCDTTAPQPRGGKRPRVIREVAHTRGRKKRRLDSDDELDDFIVCSDGDEEGWPDAAHLETEDEFAFCQQTLSRIRGTEAPPSQRSVLSEPEQLPANSNRILCDANSQHEHNGFPDTVTNTLLIAGPPGCGKTAAIYACAEELGWDVFEVYPGIGRRSAASLDFLVGDVGKNHIIQVAQERSTRRTMKVAQESRAPLAALFAKGSKGEPKPFAGTATRGSKGTPIDIESDRCSDATGAMTVPRLPREHSSTDVDSYSPKPTAGGRKSVVRQSLVLLEEVDILFKDDTSFWPAVVNLIRDCKRPVVMTCNDLRLVPHANLPLQTVLVFEPCPPPVAVGYLQSLTLADGWLVPREDLMALYETTHTIDGIDMPESPLYPRTEPLPCPDLRRTITQLQMLCSSAARGSTSDMLQGTREARGHVRRSGQPISAESNATRLPSTEHHLWRRMSQHADLLSFVNSNLCRTPLRTPEVMPSRGAVCPQLLIAVVQALSFAATEPTADDEVGHSLLLMDAPLSDTRQGLVFAHHDELIAQDAIRLSRGVHEELATDPTATSINPAASLTRDETEIFRSRVVYQSEITGALQDIIQPPGPLMPQSSVFLDYIPWVRYMVMVDDDLERMALEETSRGKSGRTTRNSMKTRHIRNIDLDERQQEVLCRTRLDGKYQGTIERAVQEGRQ